MTIRPEASMRLHAVYDPIDDSLRGLRATMGETSLDEVHSFVTDAIRVAAEIAGDGAKQ